jgi:hypothetical protein
MTQRAGERISELDYQRSHRQHRAPMLDDCAGFGIRQGTQRHTGNNGINRRVCRQKIAKVTGVTLNNSESRESGPQMRGQSGRTLDDKQTIRLDTVVKQRLSYSAGARAKFHNEPGTFDRDHPRYAFCQVS